MKKTVTLSLLVLIGFMGWHIAEQVNDLQRAKESAPVVSDSWVDRNGPVPVESRPPDEVRSLSQPPPSPIPVEMVPVADQLRDQWPRWRGPSGQGLVDNEGFPDQWSDTENVIWKVPTRGEGTSSPIVCQDRIIFTTAYADGLGRSVVCFRSSDGKLMWETLAPEAPPEHEVHRKNGHASSTPCTDGERIYAFLGAYGLVCLDFDGNQIWHSNVEVRKAYHGTACSPLLYKDRIILYQDQNNESFVSAFDTETGDVIWQTKRRATVGWGSPVAVRAGDRDLIVVSSQYEVVAYDPENGTPVWSCSGIGDEVIPTPVAGHGLLFCSSGRSGPTLAIHPGGSGDVTDSHLVWLVTGGSPFVPSALLLGDYLYMVNDTARVARCLEAKTGKELWRERLASTSSSSASPNRTRRGRTGVFSASPVSVDNKVFFTNEQGATFVLQAGPEFRLLHVNQLNARVLASPALVDGRWYFRTDDSLICIGHEAG